MAKKKLLDEEIDYSDRIMTQISRGAPVEEVADTLGQRMDKISNDSNLSKYANDRYTQAAMDYIKQGGQNKPFSYEAAPTYTSKYAAQIDSLMNDIFGTTYDGWKQGAEYGALENRYKGLGQNAMQDTLAQVSARTGGLASSYAGGAAQGAYNNYMQSLEEAALALYNNQQAQKQNQLSMLQGLENADYNKHLDRVGQYNADRNLEYNLFRDKKDAEQLAKDNKFREQQYADNLEQQSWENQFREQQYADTMSQQAWENQFNERKYNDALSQQAWENSLKLAAAENDGEGDTGYSISDIAKLVEKEIIDAETARQMLGLGGGEPIDTPLPTDGNPTLYNQILDSFKGMQAGYSKEMLREALLSVAGNPGDPGALSEEEIEQLMDIFGL